MFPQLSSLPSFLRDEVDATLAEVGKEVVEEATSLTEALERINHFLEPTDPPRDPQQHR